MEISGTRLREMFARSEPIPPEFSRPEVVAVLQAYYDAIGQRSGERKAVAGVRAGSSLTSSKRGRFGWS